MDRFGVDAPNSNSVVFIADGKAYTKSDVELRSRVPAGTELDSWNGRTFVSRVGFMFLNTKLLGVPVPFHRNFEEVNLRFHVRRESDDGWRRGVVFVKEIVPRWAIAAVARWNIRNGASGPRPKPRCSAAPRIFTNPNFMRA